MASSSVSQEDVEVDYEVSSRRSKIRTARARNFNSNSCTSRPGDGEECDGGDDAVGAEGTAPGGSGGVGWLTGTSYALHPGAQAGEHDVSPKPINRVKEKRVTRAGNVNKGKQQRDRRKLREKRRSTGVVHLPSTESTGGSTGEEDELLSMSAETRRNTHYNHNLDDSVSPQPGHGTTNVPTDYKHHKKPFSKSRNKSPSDLEADDEDNQDYDSLTMSDSTLSLAQSSGIIVGGAVPKLPFNSSHHHHHRSLTHASSKYELLKQPGGVGHPALLRGTTYCSGVCSRGGHVVHAPVQLTANRPSNGRPATPSSHSSEELLERAREENRRLLELLAEREQRIAALEGRLALVSSSATRATRSLDGSSAYTAGGIIPPTSGRAGSGSGAAAAANTSSSSVATSGSSNSSTNLSSTNVSSSVNNGLDHATRVTQAMRSLTTD